MPDGFSSERARLAFFAWQNAMKRKDEMTPSGRCKWGQWWREKYGEYEAEILARLDK